jgi:replicative DNA helicase
MKAAPTLAHSERWGLEERLLGSVLGGREPGRVLDKVTPSDFSHPGQRALCAFLQDRHALGLPVDLPTVSDALMQSDPDGIIDRLGGWELLGGRSLITSASLKDETAEEYIRTLKRASLADRQLRTMQDLAQAIGAGDLERQGALRDALQSLMDRAEALERRRRGTGEPVLEWSSETWSRALYGIEKDMATQAGPLGLAFGIACLDDRLRPGLRPGRFWVIGAGTGEGKTVLAFMLALNAARQGMGVLYLSFEMPGEELLERAAAMETGLEWWQIQERELPEGQTRRKLTGWTPPPGLLVPTVAGLRARYIPRLVGRARKKLAEKGLALALVVVDHLQLVRSGEKVETRALEVKEAANLCKELALDGAGEGPLAVLALSQLRRARDTESPALFDLKESGGIEEAADAVLFLTRKRNKGFMTDQATVTVSKNRGGKIWERPEPLTFDGTRARFR